MDNKGLFVKDKCTVGVDIKRPIKAENRPFHYTVHWTYSVQYLTHNITVVFDSATILNHMFATQTLSRCWSTPLWSKIPTTAAAATTTAQVPRNAGRGHHPHMVGPGGGRNGICFSPPGASPAERQRLITKSRGRRPRPVGASTTWALLFSRI